MLQLSCTARQIDARWTYATSHVDKDIQCQWIGLYKPTHWHSTLFMDPLYSDLTGVEIGGVVVAQAMSKRGISRRYPMPIQRC
jgi:hypothetical protein